MTAPSPTSPTSGDPLVNTIVDDRYQVHALVGRGGMCSVYRAEDLRSGSQVALKVLPSERAENAEMAARFQREAATGKRIKHPNVVSISDSGKLADGSLYLVMEFLDGTSLTHLLESGPLPRARAVEIARQMLLGLEAAHQLGIAHRDVKPDNVMIVGDRVKLLDFGIAKNERAAFKLTAAGLAFGTPEYISPEMAMGLDTDARSDLYSVGIVLFQMLTGRLPFEGDQTALLRAHIDAKPPVPNVSRALDELILRSLEKLPEKRFPSAAAMIAALDQTRARNLATIIAIVVFALVTAIIWYKIR